MYPMSIKSIFLLVFTAAAGLLTGCGTLSLQDVKNYDGSWTEYGSLVGVPVELG